MPSRRNTRWSAPRSPLAIAAPAALTMRSFSEAENLLRFFLGTTSSGPPRTLGAAPEYSSLDASGLKPVKRFGTIGTPFSAHRYRDIQGGAVSSDVGTEGFVDRPLHENA